MPQPLSHNSSTTSWSIKEVDKVGWGKRWQTTKVVKHGFFPITKVWHPPPLILWNHALFIQCCTTVAGCGFILIDVHIYMMPNYNVPNSTIYHWKLSLLPKHSQPNRWWAFALSSSPWLITLYTSCKWGQNRGHYIPLPLGITPSSVFHYIYTIHI